MALDRDEAFRLFTEWNQNDGLVKHGLAVEAAVRAYARKFGEDENKWGITGLLHDIDYERHPTIEEHGKVGAELLREHGYPEDVVHAVQAHNAYHGLARDDLLSKTVFACDELTGLITATALVLKFPSKRIAQSSTFSESIQKAYKGDVSLAVFSQALWMQCSVVS